MVTFNLDTFNDRMIIKKRNFVFLNAKSTPLLSGCFCERRDGFRALHVAGHRCPDDSRLPALAPCTHHQLLHGKLNSVERHHDDSSGYDVNDDVY